VFFAGVYRNTPYGQKTISTGKTATNHTHATW
jgi:hypothetical protein